MRLFFVLILILSACGESRAATDSGTDGGGTDVARDSSSDTGTGTDSGTDSGTSSWATCDTSEECVVQPESCCGRCGTASPDDMVGVNMSRTSEQRAEACAEGGDCPACDAPADPYLVATCVASSCEARDVRLEGLTACTTNEDCVLTGTECCDCNSHTSLSAIAINRAEAGTLSGLVCTGDVLCPPCAPSFDGLIALCDTGACVVASAPSPGGS